ncbi:MULTISPECIES: microviridin/marinostatin family tricyclic proteinase inhibitor [unclassified Nostoc]|uniref:microviridin/marinostatin family tricyclic proteinase inhibitor n=1 Tax=unclassified Nostoc TaxID=2593658 RepID=UPI002AD51BB6|nr:MULTISPECIES: microviridin/marinostatin family tricyclic proteinase inhibitor [unclassified Nostoc]MDZ8122110.1 microviridin/marinostatin family tricyclic proteinase inhibitor [Nostoc sp. CmiVER01]MDZ8227738.1 microviridin/marinostatin family tricyclic proteinase inhibitor [Nostoc sp. ChiVER01]
MSENKSEKLNSQAVPFFARFLEGQSFEDLSDQESEGIGGGNCGVTKKEKDELVQTRKYPSDQEDGVTKKHPSDDDQIFVTLKFPSDSEDSAEALKIQK